MNVLEKEKKHFKHLFGYFGLLNYVKCFITDK